MCVECVRVLRECVCVCVCVRVRACVRVCVCKKPRWSLNPRRTNSHTLHVTIWFSTILYGVLGMLACSFIDTTNSY